MDKQIMIVINREYGSGGHHIARDLSERLGISFYDRNMLDAIAMEKNINGNNLQHYDEKPRNMFTSRTVRGHSNSPEDIVAQMQFDYIRSKADSSESFVIVGRCAEQVLKGREGLITIFILGDTETKMQRVSEERGVSLEKAKAIMNKHDKKRRAYHNFYCDLKWRDPLGYDLMINSSHLGLEKTTNLLEDYVRERTYP